MQAQQTVVLPWNERILQERRAKAHDEGVLEGIQTLLLFQLTHKFGELPSDFVKQLSAIKEHEFLSAIIIQVLTVQSLDEIKLMAAAA